MRSVIIGCLLLGGFARTEGADEVRHLDVVVRDGRSRIVSNLETPDFSITENGRAATVRGVKMADPKQTHLLSLLFDNLSGEPARLARDAAFELVNAAAKSNVRIAVFEADPSMTVRQPFTADWKSVRSAIDRATVKKRSARADASAHPPNLQDNGEASVTQNILRAGAIVAREARTRPAIVALLALIRGQSAQPGRKTVVYFSQGLPVDPREEGFRSIVSAANRAGVAFYSVDAAGLAISRDEEARRAVALQTVMRASGDAVAGREAPGGGPPTTNYEQTAITATRVDRHAASGAPPSALAALARATGGFMVENSASFRGPMRRIAEESNNYYEISYLAHDSEPDGRFRTTRIETKKKLAVQEREGYFATPDLTGRPALPYELALLGALERSPAPREFAHQAALVRFRSDDGKRLAPTVSVEVSAKELQFQQDETAGVFRARVSVLALVRGEDGTVLERFGGDTPILCPPGMLEDMKKRFLSTQKQVDLPAGKYILETAAHDRIAGRFSTSRSEFTIAAPDAGLALSSITVARAVTATGGDSERDAGFHLDGKTIQPALDGQVTGGPNTTATLYFKVYPQAGAAASPVDLGVEVMQGERRLVHSAMKLEAGSQSALAEVLSLDIGKLAPGVYDLRVYATQGQSRASEHTRLVVEGGSAAAGESVPADTEVKVERAAEPRSVPPTAEQQKLLELTRDNALKYFERLPNFICTQATRRMVDAGGKGDWRTVEESSELLSFYDGQEHYSPLTSRAQSKPGEWPASVTSAGEFGSMLKEVFDPASGARFAWVRTEQIRGRSVQIFSYAVEAVHSRYRVTYRGAQQKAPVFSAFRGFVSVDPETATVLRLTLETDPLPADIPVRQISLALDYDDVAVADQVYLLPIAVTIDVRLHKRTVARNEVSFRSYQRFSADSRITYQAR